MNSHTMPRWALLTLILLAVVLIPFALIGGPIEEWTTRFLTTAAEHPILTAAVLAVLLISDILLPIPSSLVSTAAGYILGMAGGTLTSLIGMTIGSVAGYKIGIAPGRVLARRVVGDPELERARRLYERFGEWLIVVARPVPVLAEISAFFAGIARMPFGRFMTFSLLANLGISAAYAAVGAYAAGVDSFLSAFAGAILLPLLGMLTVRIVGR